MMQNTFSKSSKICFEKERRNRTALVQGIALTDLIAQEMLRKSPCLTIQEPLRQSHPELGLRPLHGSHPTLTQALQVFLTTSDSGLP